jgi:hypothetical protein
MTDAKPCACGRDGCIAVRREGEKTRDWERRKYAADACRNESRSACAHSQNAPDPLKVRETKPCKCGRESCTVRRREREKLGAWVKRRFASRSCSTSWNNANRPEMREARSAGGRASAVARGPQGMCREAGALVTPPEWLDRPSGRIAAQRAAHGISVP